MSLRTVGVRLTAEVSQFVSGMKRAGAATKDFGSTLDKSAKAGNLDHVADRAGVAGIALAGMAGYAIKAAADFDKSMSAVKAATNDSTKSVAENAKNMKDLRAAALQAGKDTSFSATEAADGITQLAKAGVATSDILKGGLAGALNLAAAGQLSVGEASETAASAMTQFKLSGKDVPHIADLLAAGAGKAQGSVHDMGAALSQSGLVASQFGLSIEDSTGTLAAFASAGLTGSDAGTSFKQMLLQLANPAAKTKDLMEDLGISAYDAQGKFVGITNLAEQLKTKLSGLTQAQRDAALAQIFGSDAIRSANVLYQQGGAGIQTWISKVNDAGYASKTAATMTDNLAGDIERLKGSLETLAIESGSGANGGLRKLTQGVESLVDQFGRMPSAVSGSLTVIAGVAGVALIGLAAFIKLRKGLAEAVAQLTAMGPAGEKAAAGLQKTAGAAGKAAIAFAALEAGAAVLNSFGPGAANVDRLTDSLLNFSNTGNVAGEAADLFGTDLHGLGDDAAIANSGMVKWLDKIEGAVPIFGDAARAATSFGARIAGKDDYQTALQNFDALDQALTNTMNTTNDARKASDLWNKVASESGIPIDRLIELLPSAYKKVGELNKAQMEGKTAGDAMASGTNAAADGAGAVAATTPGATEETKKYTTAAQAAAGAARGEHAALSALANFMKAETDPVFAFIESQKALAKAQKDAKDAQKELDKALDKHGPKSKEAKAATDKLNESTRTLATSAIDLQDRTGALGDTFNGKMTPALRDTLKAAGLTAPQIKILEQQFKNAKKAADAYDGKYEAIATAPGAKQAKKDLDAAYSSGKQYDGSYIARLSVNGDKPVNAKLDEMLVKQRALMTGLSVSSARAAVQKDLDRNRQKGYRSGGRTPMVGEDEPAGVVHGKEFVFNARTVRRIDQQQPGFLDEVHATGQLPGYAGGGRVLKFAATAAKTDIPTWAEVASHVAGNFGNWPSSPSAQRGDSGIWRKVLALARSSGLPVHFGNGYRPGDPLWHGSGRADDLMGYNQDRLANFFLGRQGQILEMIHRSNKRDYAYTRGRNKGSFNETLMNAHRNHLHIAMRAGGTINEPVMGFGASGRSYSFGENYQPERVVPNWQPTGSNGGTGVSTVVNLNVQLPLGVNPGEAGRQLAQVFTTYLNSGGTVMLASGKQVLP